MKNLTEEHTKIKQKKIKLTQTLPESVTTKTTQNITITSTATENNNNILKNEMIEQSNTISNREALKEKIHEIHNFLRNNGAGYGMNALKVFNIIYGLKKIEENGLLDKVNLKRPECDFSYLLPLANEEKGERIAELIFGDVLQSIYDSRLKYILFYEIPHNIRGSVLIYLIKEINKISDIEKKCNVLLSGKIYEYFIGRDETAISELGAYFTDRHIVDYILNKLNPKKNEIDGNIPSMIDMFGGSGGFTTGYIDYYNKKYPNQINWETELKKVHHYDMNEDVIKSAGLELFCLTGVLPDINNLQYKNSFTDEFYEKKYFYPITNPPYGGDKSGKTEAQTKREKVKEFIKNELMTVTDEETRKRRQTQLKTIDTQEKQEKKEVDRSKVTVPMCSGRIQRFAYKNKLKGNDKEACSLMLLMDILEVGGTACGVLKEGVFFNKTYGDLRKCLIEKYNVREVISIPQDQFENTSTKTSVLIFDNTEQKTTEVKFSELTVKRYEEDKFNEILGDIMIVENKGDIFNVEDILVSTATKDEILQNPICSLNGKDYGKKELVVGEGYDLVKLGSICEFLPKSKRSASYGKETGTYNFYTSSDKVQKCDEADYNDECLIIGSGGVANIKKDIVFSCSADNFILKPTNKIHLNYLYSLFKGKINLLSDGFTGSVLKHLSKEYLKNLQIPIPKTPEKIQEWVNKISAPYDEKNVKQNQIKELEVFVQNKIREFEDTEECEEVELGNICKFQPKSKRCASYGNKTGTYNFYTSSNKVQKCEEADYNEDVLIIGSGGVANIKKDNIFSCSADNFILKPTNKIHLNYLYILFKGNMALLSNGFTGSVLKHLSKDYLKKIKIKLPKNKQLIQDLEPTFQQIETLQNEVKTAETLYQQYIEELSQEAMPTP